MRQTTLVDSQDQVLSNGELLQTHANPAQLHRAISVWLLRQKDGRWQTLLQKRSSSKIVGASEWGNSVCGNVRPDESYESAAWWRLGEEIGVKKAELNLELAYKFSYRVHSNDQYGEHEMDQVFVGVLDKEEQDFELNGDEVSAVRWVDIEELKQKVSEYPREIPTADQTLEMDQQELREKTFALDLILDGQEIKIAPWTAIMLGDDRLWYVFDQLN